MATKIITPVAVEPVTLAELQAHLRLYVVAGVTPDDAMIQGQLSAAREYAEHYTGRALAPQTLELALDAFPVGAIDLPGVPVTSITSIKYIDVAGTEQTLVNTAYSLNDYGITARAERAFGTTWPSTQTVANALKVRYVAGYVAGTLPRTVRAALLLFVGHLYENRQEVSVATMIKTEQLPMGVKALLDTVDCMAL